LRAKQGNPPLGPSQRSPDARVLSANLASERSFVRVVAVRREFSAARPSCMAFASQADSCSMARLIRMGSVDCSNASSATSLLPWMVWRKVEDGLHDVLLDREGTLWITRMNSGIVRVRYPERLGNRKLGPHDHELESFDEKDGFSGGFAYRLFEDREGNIWVGCSKGLIRFRHNQVVPVSLPHRYQKLVLLAGEDGEIWIGAVNGKPLLHVRGESLVEKVGGRTSSVFRGSNGDVWWGCDTGIWRQNGTKFKYFPIPKGAEPPTFIYEIIPSRDDGGLWVRLGDFGTVHFKQGVWNLGDRPKGVPIAGPSASYHDPSGRVWLGFDAGQVYVLDGEQVTAYSQNDGLDVGRIKVIRGLGQHIWVGGELGLMFFSEGRFRRMTVAAGEQFGAVSGIIETVDDGLWLNEMTGIVQIPLEEIRRFMADPNHRVKYRRFGILSSHRDDCGRLVEDDPRRFGFHNLRHSLASFLVRIRTDPKTVQTLLRHSDVKLTLQFYSHAVSQDRMAAAGEMLTAILSHAVDQSGLKAD
jgi:ligand-binding sensor domain-containing protein